MTQLKAITQVSHFSTIWSLHKNTKTKSYSELS